MPTSDTSPETTPPLDQQAREVVGNPRAVKVCKLRNGQWLSLTPRQMEVAGMLASGLPDKLIARQTGLSLKTVWVHTHRVFEAAGCESRTQLVATLADAVLLQRSGRSLADSLIEMFAEAVSLTPQTDLQQ